MGSLLRATSTPLASIFGSGFLVIVPILNGAAGPWAIVAMAAVCALAYAVGGVIRFNIRHVEPVLASSDPPHRLRMLERSSDAALVLAYVVSVCLYVNILAAFLLGGIGEAWDTPRNEHLLSAVVIAALGLVGYVKGLDMLERLEDLGLWITMAIIVALFVGFGAFDWAATRSPGGITWPSWPSRSAWDVATIVGGTLIVVQGFETSRYLGAEFDADLRVRSCRLAQLIAAGVYLVFIALATPLMHFLGDVVKDNDLIMLAAKASPLLPIPLICAAVLSQFSAAVADTLGGGGNTVEATQGNIDARHAYLFICGGAVLLAVAPTLTILTLASKAFAFYYMLQCLVACEVTDSSARRAAFLVLAAVLAFVAIFAVPAG
jgi:hypothetical protein